MPPSQFEECCQKALRHDIENWQLLNACPACFYCLKNEPELEFDWLVSIDDNNSLKCWNKSVYGIIPLEDSHNTRSDFWLSEQDINHFQYKAKAKSTHMGVTNDMADWETEETDSEDMFNCVQ
ncbi:hypothetical protein J3R82DRAFT_113 [Butyriboletus roseoflavus]|nr:hypothetical protein J3R82DRAFT_113 [Butyriboletus roseoflavus]